MRRTRVPVTLPDGRRVQLVLPDQRRNAPHAAYISDEQGLHPVEVQPGAASFYDTLARIQIKSGDRDAAVATFRKALALQPNSLEALIGQLFLVTVVAVVVTRVSGAFRRQ